MIASGDWWTLDDTGLLSVFCVGNMPDYSYSYSRYAPWYSIRASVTSLRVADSVTSIGDWAFYLCGNLSDAIISASVTSIGYGAFRFCKGLTSVTIPNGVISIGNSAFYYCESLTSVTIPSSVTSIGYGAFEFCYGLTAFLVDSGNQTYSSENGVLFNKNRSNLLCCPQGKTGAYEIPNGVTSIEGSAFAYCKSLTSVVMPDGMTSIGNDAFWQCDNLTSVTIPSSVTSIGYDAFGDCIQLISVTIPDGLTFIESGTFTSCESLTSVTIPASVTDIGEAAFNACESLTDVYYAGTEAQWNEIYIDEANNDLRAATIHYNYAPTPPPVPLAPGTFTVAVSYTHDGQTFTTSFSLNMVSSYCEITSYPAKTDYFVGETLDYTGLEVTEAVSDGTWNDVTAECVISPAEGTEITEPGDIMVSVSYDGATLGTFWISVA